MQVDILSIDPKILISQILELSRGKNSLRKKTFKQCPDPDPVFLGHPDPDPGKYRIRILYDPQEDPL